MGKNNILLLAVAALLSVTSLSAQTKAETSLYNKTLKKPSLKAYNKFLTKFPDSTYSLEILTLRDSALFDALDQENAEAVEAFAAEHPDSPLSDKVQAIIDRHNTSPLSVKEAEEIFTGLVPDVQYAASWRQRNHDYVVAPVFKDGVLSLVRCVKGAEGQWAVDESRTLDRYLLDSKATEYRYAGEPEIVTIGGRRLIGFGYYNQDPQSSDIECVRALYDWDNDMLTNAMFYGKERAGGDGIPAIEGQCPEAAMTGGIMMPEMAYLLNYFAQDSHFTQISKADALTDDSIKWWLEKNPTAETRATRLTFGALDEESSLVAGFKAASKKNKDSSKAFNVALFDIRGYTVIVAYSKAYKNYILVWCEPVCKNKNRDKLLNTIYFEDDNTLDMFYYKGKTTFKYRVNLATKALKR